MDEGPGVLVTLLAALALVAVHLFAGRLRFLDRLPRSRWLSAAGGVSVAYVFVHLLPELAHAQEAVAEAAGGFFPYLEEHAYLLALVGLTVFYGVERHSARSRERRREAGGEDCTEGAAFWMSMTSFAVYNGLIGYLIVHGESETAREVAFFTVALGVHFVVNDHSLREHHRHAYHRFGRWLISAAVLAGWVVGELTGISEAALGLVLAFLAGGIVLNVLKEELPNERQSSLAAFVGGAALYAALLLAV